MEFLSQYNATICYFPGKKNTVADALSHLPETTIPTITVLITVPEHSLNLCRFALKDALLMEIKQGYKADPFTEKLHTASQNPFSDLTPCIPWEAVCSF